MNDAIYILQEYDSGGAHDMPTISTPQQVEVIFSDLVKRYPQRQFWYVDGQCGLEGATWANGEDVVLAWT